MKDQDYGIVLRMKVIFWILAKTVCGMREKPPKQQNQDRQRWKMKVEI